MRGNCALRQRLTAGETALGLWVTLEAPTITELACELGFDYVVIDAEHGHLDFKEILEHLRATRGSEITPLVRVAGIEQGLIKRVLDLGAAGILVPQVESAAEVERAIRFAKYPPWGVRGLGGERATGWGLRMAEAATANEATMVIPLLETVAAAACLEDILAVRGVDAVQFGPADFSSSSGYIGQWKGPGVAEQLLRCKDTIRAHGIPCGILATDIEDSQRRAAQGFQLIALASDTGLLIRGARQALAAFGRG